MPNPFNLVTVPPGHETGNPEYIVSTRELLRKQCKRPDTYVMMYWRENEFGRWIDSNLTDESLIQVLFDTLQQLLTARGLEIGKLN